MHTQTHIIMGAALGGRSVRNAWAGAAGGLLPDLPAPEGAASPWDRFKFLGNTSIRGAYRALLSRDARNELTRVAGMMTYLELSADNSFYDAFTSALFLPHTDMTQFPTVEMALAERN